MRYVVQLEPGVWLAPWRGNPGRTDVEAGAIRFRSRARAEMALDEARSLYPFTGAQIIEVEA